MQPWQKAATCAALLIALHFLLMRAAAGRVNDVLGAFVLEGVAALGLCGAYVASLGSASAVTSTASGIAFAGLSGLCISASTGLIFYALRVGGPISSTGTIVLGGGVVLSTLVAPLVFAEPISVRRALGVTLGICAMWLLSTEAPAAPQPDLTTEKP